MSEHDYTEEEISRAQEEEGLVQLQDLAELRLKRIIALRVELERRDAHIQQLEGHIKEAESHDRDE